MRNLHALRARASFAGVDATGEGGYSRALLLGLAAFVALVAAFGGRASSAEAAFVSCTYDPIDVPGEVVATTDTVTPSVLSVGASGAILADGTACGAATVTNIDLIRVNYTAPFDLESFELVIDESGGSFGPGATDEPGSGSDEIEFEVDLVFTFLSRIKIVGTDGPDHVVAGAGGINLNAAEPDDDIDVSLIVDSPVLSTPTVEMTGLAGDDTLSLFGFEGTGAIYPAGSGAVLDGGPGRDTLWAGDEDTQLLGGEGNDELHGGPDDDTLLGGPDSDWMFGEGGNDQLSGGDGFDLLDGGPGSDALDGGSDDDWASYRLAPAGVVVVLPGGTAPGADGHGASDTFVSIERLEGSVHDDVLTGSDGSDHITAGPGNDVVSGGGGNDSIIGRSGNDEISGGLGDDSLFGDDGDDLIRGGPGNDSLVDGGGDDRLFGDEGDDSIEASEWDPDEGLRPVGADILSGGEGIDTVAYWHRLAGVTVTLDGIANDGPGLDNVGGPANDVENLEGSLVGDDTLIGNNLANELEGLGGNDILRGRSGDDRLVGGLDNDALFGGGGIDALIGEAGNDRLLGKAGEDLLKGGADADALAGGGGDDRLHGGSGDDTLRGGFGNDLLRGKAGTDLLRGEAGDDRLFGAASDDVLRGGLGSDRLFGQTGNDALLGGLGIDRANGGAGNDLCRAETRIRCERT